MNIDIKYNTVQNGYDRKTCWVQTRAGYAPDSKKSVITTQKLRLSGSDIFYAIHSMHSKNGGGTWSELVEQEVFAPRYNDDGSYFYVSDFWPKWNAASNTMLGTGHAPLYKNDEICPASFARRPVFATYDLENDVWNDWKMMELPDEPLLFNCGSGSVQRLDLPNGVILLPVYCRDLRKSVKVFGGSFHVCVLRCSFDGLKLRYIERGNFMTVKAPRGLCEPSLSSVNGKYYLTIRNDEKGYVAVSDDGLNFSTPAPWLFDDGSEIGNYNTQQHWMRLVDKLFLVYTRKGLKNDHVFRHRAPLVISEFDPERLCLIRSTERIVVPERGARLGNFGVTEITDTEAWVVVSEWMQGPKGTNGDPRELEAYGSDNAIFIARMRSK